MKKIRPYCTTGAISCKINLKMRLTIFLLLLTLFRINANTYSQNTKISIDVEEVSIEKVLDLIKEKTEFKIFFKNSDIPLQNKISLHVKNRRVDRILNEIFRRTNVSYRVLDKQIILVQQNKQPKIFRKGIYVAPQEELNIKGVVVDRDGIPVSGATVLIDGTKTGVAADFDGNFELTVKKGAVLVIESLGFITQKLTVQNAADLRIVLEEDVEQLDEIVVSDGYKKVAVKNFTGVATRLKLEDIKIDAVADPARLLEGKDAGVVVDNLSGSFGASPRIRIRGNTSINGNNNPIWVIDGVILEDNVELNQDDLASGDINSLIGSSTAGLNPDDIDTFSILKDASATALYGARAKNGVILITTKKGAKGSARVTYNNSFAYRLRPRYESFNVLNSQQELSVYSELVDKGLVDVTTAQTAESFGVLGKYFQLRGTNEAPIGANGQLSNSYFNRYQKANTDWFKVLFKDLSLQQTHSVNISGGSDDAIYYFSLSYLDDEGQTIGDNVKRYTAKMNTKFNLSEKFSISTAITGSIRDQQAPGTNNRNLNPLTGEFQREFDINPYSYSLSNSRSVTPYDASGELEFFRKNYAPFNIIHELNNNYINIDVTDITFQTDLDYKITDNVRFNTTLNYRKAITQREHVIGDDSNQANAFRADQGPLKNINPFLYQDLDNLRKDPYSILPEGGINIYNEDVLDYVYIRNSITWDPKINDDNRFSILLGQEIKNTERQSREYNGIGIAYNNGYLVNTNPDAIDQLIDGSDQYFEISNFNDRFSGLFFNASFTHKDKYIFNGTLRYDGSNLQGKSKKARYLTNYNVSGAWNIHKEDFMTVDWLDVLKLKATYGLSGGRGPLTSASLDLRGRVPLRPQDSESTIEIESLANDDLTFEKLKEFSVGLEFAVLRNRIAGELGYYKRNSFDLIGEIKTSGIGGEAFKTGNYADLKIEGYEFAISSVNIKTANFKWTTNFNIGYNTEKITELKFNPRLVDLVTANGSPFTGREISALYSVRFAGLNNVGIPTFFNAENEVVTDIDLQSREDIEKILQYEGPTQPRGAGGLSNTFTYKGFSLNANISFKFDYKIRLNGAFSNRYTDFNSLPKELINRWRLPGDEAVTNIPAILDAISIEKELNGQNGDNAYELYNNSDLRVADGSYARLRSMSLAYRVPHKFAEKIGLASARVRLQAENLFLIYSDKDLKGQDPEFFNSGGAALPLSKIVSLSFNIGF